MRNITESKRLQKKLLRSHNIEEEELSMDRPAILAECPTERPCPWVACRYSLSLDVARSGFITHLECSAKNCCLDHIDPEEIKSFDTIAGIMGISRESVRTAYRTGMKKMAIALREFEDD